MPASERLDIPAEEGAGIEEAHNAKNVEIDFSWLSSMEEKLVCTKSSPSFTICQAPAKIRRGDHAAYNPQIVSIGPFHRRRKNLQDMEEHKRRYLCKVLAFAELGNNLEKFVKELKALETEARNCYSGNIQMGSKEFVEMMMLDGCFVIFLILQQTRSLECDVLISDNYWMLRLILFDMLLLENQLPFFVLECLWELIGQPRETLRNEVLASFSGYFSYKLELTSPEDHVIHHLLHLLHLSLQPDSPTRFRTPSQQSLLESQHGSPQPWNMIPSVTELKEAGVTFQLVQARSFYQVRFEQGLMKMPCLWIYEETNILFRNLMAFERCFPKWGNHCTSYCVFIYFLVKTPRDVSILRKASIIRNGLGSDEEVAPLFNKLCKEIVLDPADDSYLAYLLNEVDRHTQKIWPKWRARLVRDNFFRAIISVVAATIILFLTFFQTYFSVFAYFKPPKP